MEIKVFKNIPDEARKIREEVFIVEQGFKEEFDDTDGVALHIVAYDGNRAVGTCRIFTLDDKADFILGRLAVLKDYRGKGFGAFLVRSAEDTACENGGKSIRLHSQTRASEFYEKQGYEIFGEIEYEEYCPHIWMKKALQPANNI